MYGEEIAKCVSVGNVVLVCIAIAIAVCGVFVLLNKFFKWTNSALFNMGNFIPTFCIAAIVALIAEATVFNFQHYLKFFAGDEIEIVGMSSNNPHVFETSEKGIVATIGDNIVFRENTYSRVIFYNLDRPVTSIFVDLAFDNIEQTTLLINWYDEIGGHNIFLKDINKRFPRDFYTPLQPNGNVQHLVVAFRVNDSEGSGNIRINNIVLNKQIPLYFSGLRMFVLSFLIFCVITLLGKNLRAKTAHVLFEYKVDFANKKQNYAYVFAVILLLMFSWICVYTTVGANESFTDQQYSKYLVDALIAGRTNLDYGNPQKLLELENPYNLDIRREFIKEHNLGAEFEATDWTWYKGKYYSYYGVVPAVMLLVPYKLITGNYLSMYAATALLTTVLIIFMALLWRFCVRKYMPNMRFVFYMLSFLTLFSTSALYTIVRRPAVSTIVMCAGIMFAIAGIYLLLKSVDKEKINKVMLFCACLCFALIAGCRPQITAISLLVPVVLWDKIWKQKQWKLLLFIAAPFIMVAIPLMWYNYVRFESVFQFGQSYTLTNLDIAGYSQVNPLGLITRMFVAVMYYLFYPLHYQLHFPFVFLQRITPPDMVTQGAYRYFCNGGSITSFPIVLCLVYYFRNLLNKDKPKVFHVLSTLLITATITMLFNSAALGFQGRYLFDMAFFIILPSLFCAHYWCVGLNGDLRQKNERLSTAYMSAAYLMFAVSIFIGLFLFVNGGWRHPLYDPTLYRYLEYSLGIIRDV